MAIINGWNLPNCGIVPIQNGAGPTSNSSYKNRFNIINNTIVEVQELTVHQFTVHEEDPVLYAAEPLYKWQESECGKWVTTHAVEKPIWHRSISYTTLGYTFIIKAKLKAKDATYFRLKWGDKFS